MSRFLKTIHSNHRFLGLVLMVVCCVLDQLTKHIILFDVMNPPQLIPITSFFNLTLAWNTGVSFSLFNDYGVTGTYVLIVVSSGISLFFLHWLWKSKDPFLASGIGMILGGAVGNIIDRIRYGAVVDFLDFYIQTETFLYHWPAFNLADSFITIGVLFILIDAFKGQPNIDSKRTIKDEK